MSQPNRRDFLMASIAGAAALSSSSILRAAGANDRLRVGLIGCGGRGNYLLGVFRDPSLNVDIVALADADENRLGTTAIEVGVPSSARYRDMRQLLDDKSIDAVIVATPDHWHSPASILACDAGKHVYVEKPCSHNLREGRLLVEAAKRNNRVVQHGTQVRSTSMMIEAVKRLREGIIGDVLVSKAWNIQMRRSIGREQPSTAPAELDYDNWVGPAAFVPYQKNRAHDGWHWWYNFGTGDMGNDGIHDVEYARWGLGVETHPTRISASGGKYFFDDDQEFPDTQQVTFEYDSDGKPGSRRMLIFEQRLWSNNYPYNVDSGVELYGTKGQMFLSRRGKAQIWDGAKQKVKLDFELKEQDAPAHVANFCDSVRNGRRPNADAEIGHLTASLCHLGNIATRLGRTLNFDPKAEQIIKDEEANRLLTREYRDSHWGTPRNA